MQCKVLNLAAAREKAETYRRMARAGIGPIEERRKSMIRVPNLKASASLSRGPQEGGRRNKRHTDSSISCLELSLPGDRREAVDFDPPPKRRPQMGGCVSGVVREPGAAASRSPSGSTEVGIAASSKLRLRISRSILELKV